MEPIQKSVQAEENDTLDLEQKYEDLIRRYGALSNQNVVTQENPNYTIRTYTTYGMFDDIIR